MYPSTLSNLVTLQKTRLAEIKGIHRRLVARPLASLNIDMIQPGIDALTRVLEAVRQTHEEIVVRPDAASDPYIVNDEIGNIRGAYDDALYAFLALRRQLQQAEAPTPTWESSYPTVAGIDLSCAEMPKMSFPKTCSVGESAEWVIKGVPTSTPIYARTWEALQALDYNARLLLFEQVQALSDLPHLKRGSITELRSLLNKMQCIVRSMKNAGWPAEKWDYLLFVLLVTQLDTNTINALNAELISRERLYRASNSDSGTKSAPEPSFMLTYTELVEFLENRMRNSLLQLNRRGEKRVASPPKSGHPRKIFHAKSGGVTNTETRISASCSLCFGSHPLWNCDRFRAKSIRERIEDVKRLRLCYNCFGRHPAKSCRSNKRCFTCNGIHHTLIHVSRRERRNTASKSSRG